MKKKSSLLSIRYQLDSIFLLVIFFVFFSSEALYSKVISPFSQSAPESELDSILTLDPGQGRLISTIYCKIISLTSSPLDSLHLKQIWEQDLGIDIPEDQWKNILGLIHSLSICARHALIQCKVLHRAHFTNAKLAKIFPNRSVACNRCKQSPADHIHMFWSCPRLMDYWSDIFRTLSQALKGVLLCSFTKS